MRNIHAYETIMTGEIIKTDIGQIVEIGEYCSVVEYSLDRIMETDQGIMRTIEVISEEEILEGICDWIRIIEVKILEVDMEGIIGTIIVKEVGVGPPRQYSDNTRRNDRSSRRSRWGSRASTNRDRIRCYKCREYDHFAKDCPTLKVEKELGKIQQMYNMDEEQTPLKLLAMDTYESLNRINLIEETAMDHLNL